eukprot:5595625-Pyramimonas_sp.AAC.1
MSRALKRQVSEGRLPVKETMAEVALGCPLAPPAPHQSGDTNRRTASARVGRGSGEGGGGGGVWSGEDADRASAPTTDRESSCTVRT